MNLLRKSPFPFSWGSERDKQHMEEIKLERIKKRKCTGACLYYFNLHMSSSCLSTSITLNQAWLWKQWLMVKPHISMKLPLKEADLFLSKEPHCEDHVYFKYAAIMKHIFELPLKNFQFTDCKNKIYFLLLTWKCYLIVSPIWFKNWYFQNPFNTPKKKNHTSSRNCDNYNYTKMLITFTEYSLVPSTVLSSICRFSHLSLTKAQWGRNC